MTKFSFALSTILTAVLMGCGGGGSDSSSDSNAGVNTQSSAQSSTTGNTSNSGTSSNTGSTTTGTSDTAGVVDLTAQFGLYLKAISENHIIPRYSVLAERADSLLTTSQQVCAMSERQSTELTSLQTSWSALNQAWQGIK